jgi:predicted small metal-binding protein
MTKILRCSDVVPGCSAVVRAETEAEVMRQAAEHARSAHGIQKIDEATAQKVRAAIRNA